MAYPERKGRMLASMVATAMAVTMACSGGGPGDDAAVPDGRPSVITSVSPITSIAESIGGTRVRVEGIIPEGTNSHTFEPAPSVARKMAQADLIVLNGLFLEEPALALAEANAKPEAVIVTLGDRAISPEEWKFDFSFPESGGHPNPHLWPNPLLALKYAELIRDELIILDPDGAEYYGDNYQAFKSRVEDLDQRIARAVATVPPENRLLLTYHDSWAYFAERYGMEVLGAVQPSDFSEPSARDVANLIDQLRELGVPAIFGSEVFPSKVMEQIAKEGGARFIDQLRDDDLPGAPGDPRHSYLGLMLTNMEVMVSALGGGTDALEGFDPGHVFEGESGAVYPQ